MKDEGDVFSVVGIEQLSLEKVGGFVQEEFGLQGGSMSFDAIEKSVYL